MQNYDLVIVGAGPGGSSAAKFAAEKGLKVLVLERRAAIGQPVRCGEMLGDDVFKEYIGEDDSIVNKTVKTVDFVAPNKKMVRFNMKNLSYVMMERALFDRKLAEMAAIAGAEIRLKCDVTSLIKEDDRICGVKFNQDSQEHEVRCKAVIAADGVESRIAHLADVPVVMKKRDVFSAWAAHVVSEDLNTDTMQFIFDSELSPGGYIWVFPKGDKFANVGLGYIAKNREEDNARKRLYDYLEQNCKEYSILTEYAGGVPASAPLEQPWVPGMFIVGDAARFTNAITGGGIGSALISGKWAGIYVHEALSTGKYVEDLGKKYYKKLKSEFVNQYSLNYKFRKLILKDYEGVFNGWIEAALKLPQEKRNSANVMLKLFGTYPKYFPMYLKSWLFKGDN